MSTPSVKFPFGPVIAIILGIATLLWLAGSWYLYSVSTSMIFLTNLSRDNYPTKTYQTIELRRSNGEKIEALWLENSGSSEYFLFLHGNIGWPRPILDNLVTFGNVLAPAYPGFSKSHSSPTTENVYETVDRSIEYLRKEKGIALNQITVFGFSLGGSPAVFAANKYPGLKKVVLVATFSSIQSMCWRQYYILCTFGGSILNSARLAPEVTNKIRQFHSPDDEVVPFAEGEKLYSYFGNIDKKFTTITGKHSEFDMEIVLRD